jgi:hypothetical protein
MQAATRCETNYAWAPNQIRRQINRGFFKSLWIGEAGNVERYELNEPFKSLLATQGPLLSSAPVDEVEARTAAAEGADGRAAETASERSAPAAVLRASFQKNDVTDSKNKTTHRRWFSSVRGLNDAYLVGAVEALSHRSTPVQRLLDLAKTWPDEPNDAGFAPPPKPFKTLRKLKPAEIDELVKRYQAGSSVYQLAELYDIHRITIGRHLRARGIDTTAPALTEEQVREAVQLYAEGWSCMKIAKHFGVGTETVRGRLHQAGLVMRGPHERTEKR